MYPNMYFVHKNKKIMEHAFENQKVQINVRIKNNALIGEKENYSVARHRDNNGIIIVSS